MAFPASVGKPSTVTSPNRCGALLGSFEGCVAHVMNTWYGIVPLYIKLMCSTNHVGGCRRMT